MTDITASPKRIQPLSWIYRFQGTIAVPPSCDTARSLPHVLADLQGRGCPAHLTSDGVLLIEGRSESRGSALAFVDNGWVQLGPTGDACALEYGFSTLGGLQLCAILSVVAASLAWFTLGSAGLTAFGFLAPLLWLYGANRVMTGIRAPALLERLCHSAPNWPGAIDSDLSREDRE